MSDNPLVRLVVLFGSLSLVSFGGGNTVIPAMHREAVVSQHWLTDRQFADLFALAQAAPRPTRIAVGTATRPATAASTPRPPPSRSPT